MPARLSITDLAAVTPAAVPSAVSPVSPDAEPLRAAMTRPLEPTATAGGAIGSSGVANAVDVALLLLFTALTAYTRNV